MNIQAKKYGKFTTEEKRGLFKYKILNKEMTQSAISKSLVSLLIQENLMKIKGKISSNDYYHPQGMSLVYLRLKKTLFGQ